MTSRQFLQPYYSTVFMKGLHLYRPKAFPIHRFSISGGTLRIADPSVFHGFLLVLSSYSATLLVT